MTNKEQVVKDAKSLAKSLGKGWTPQVWQRGGWHCCVVQGPLAVYPDPDGKFICRITDKPTEDQKPTLISSGRLYDTPIEAVKKTVGTARIVINKMDTLVKVAESVLDGSLKTHIPMDFIYQPLISDKK